MPDPDWLKRAREDGRILSEVWASDLAPEETPCRPDGNPPGITAGNVTTPSEAEFTRQVIDLARGYGWKTAHFRAVRVQRADGSCYYETPVQGEGKGFLDLELVRPPKLLKVELKVGRNPLTPEQRQWLDLYTACGIDARVWYPRDWDEIRTTLRG